MAQTHNTDVQNPPKQVTWVDDIKEMFTPDDIAHMKGQDGYNPPQLISLDSYDDVRKNWKLIYIAVKSGYMPPPDWGVEPKWDPDKVAKFVLWGTQENKFAYDNGPPQAT